jgi:hypothetical protein
MSVHFDILIRYDEILEAQGAEMQHAPEPGTSLGHLRWMLHKILNADVIGEQAHRWLGFVQGVMIVQGLTTVTEERNHTRPYFKGGH